MPVITKDQLKELGKPATMDLPLPELGEGMEIKIRGFTMGDILDINQACSPSGLVEGELYDNKKDQILSVIRAVVEPQLGPEDLTWIADLKPGITDKITGEALRLGGRTQNAYELLKDGLRANHYMRRIYILCVNRLGRLPSELKDIPESEFNTMLAALELEAESEAEMHEEEIRQIKEGRDTGI